MNTKKKIKNNETIQDNNQQSNNTKNKEIKNNDTKQEQLTSKEPEVVNEEEIKKEVIKSIDENEPEEDVIKRTMEDLKIMLATYELEDLRNVINNRLETIKEELDKLNPEENDEDLEKIKKLTEEYTNIQRIFTHYTDQLVFNREILEKIYKLNQRLLNKHDKYHVEDKSPSFDLDKLKSSKGLSKSDIKTVILAMEGDIKKISLLNSGFTIVVRDPSLSELNVLFNKLQQDMNEYGRMFGALFYLFNDYYIKEALMEFIEKLTKPNIKNANKSNVFRKMLSIHDYDVILHSIATLMYPDGYTYKFECSNENCNYKEEVKIDLNLIKYFNFDIIPEDCLSMIDRNEPLTYQNYLKYQSILGFTEQVDINKYRFYLKVPTMYEYLSYGKEFNDLMFKTITSSNKDQIENYIQYNYLKIFIPWISQVDIIDRNSNTVKHAITDKDIIMTILEVIQKYDDTLADKIVDFIKRTKVTHICYPVNLCPQCKQLPSGAVNGFIPFDVQNNFFSQCLMRLIQPTSQTKK